MRILAIKKKHLKLLVVGSGPEYGRLNSLTKKLGLAEHVRFLGKISDESLFSLYKSCAVFVLPSRWEGLPTTLLEAWVAGIPVVSTNVGGIGAVAKDRVNALVVEPDNPRKLAEKIEFALSDRNIVQKARKDANDFDWSRIVDEIQKVYVGILKSF
jgi:glycosyltransferase involved in cell wall biosynthesis